jgi:hypothetical protein
VVFFQRRKNRQRRGATQVANQAGLAGRAIRFGNGSVTGMTFLWR